MKNPGTPNDESATGRGTPGLKLSRYPLKTAVGIVFTLLALSLMTQAIRAQDANPSPSPTPTDEQKRLDEQITILTKKKQIADLEKGLAEANTAKVKAQLPTSNVTPLEGKVEVDDKVVFEGQTLAYKALSEISEKISSRVSQLNPAPHVVVIYNAADISALQMYGTIKAQVDSIRSQYATLIPGGSESGAASLLLGPEVATSFLKSVIDFASLFRTDVTIKQTAFTVDEVAIVAQVAKGLKGSGINVYYPSSYPPFLLSYADSPLLKSLSNLYQMRSRANLIIARCESDDKDIKSTCTPKNKLDVPVLKGLNAQVDKFFDDLTKVDDATKTSGLSSLLRAERLKDILSPDMQSLVLQLKVLAAAGSNKTKRNLFTGTKLYHSGGSIVSYIVYDSNGAIQLSDTLYNYDGFIRITTRNGNLGNNLNH